MSYLWTFQSFRQTAFDLLAADGSRCSSLLRLQTDAEERLNREMINTANRRRDQRPILTRLLDGFWGRSRHPFVYYDPWPDKERVLLHIRDHGITYDGLPEDNGKTLDRLIHGLFYDDSPVRVELETEMKSPDGVHTTVIEELVSRAGNSRQFVFMPLLIGPGRRIGGSTLHQCEYCFLNPDEVRQMEEEIRTCVEFQAPWTDPDLRDCATTCLLDVMATIASKGKAAFCCLG